jgi:hypothetical protein
VTRSVTLVPLRGGCHEIDKFPGLGLGQMSLTVHPIARNKHHKNH